ncbi:nucleotidyltransferase [Alloalcanivorax xenomutans]|uniref:nucleotidyltransferase n=1 Tax=Alloalcanivorax xenomutans TaxID=1094342 RepID=UPI001F393346|nr:nucleotidyltransferase [Alloalcanivorax xenomutans]MCE7524558.1 nucleotidyltransferase [Alloalcanivorax xenomutans]
MASTVIQAFNEFLANTVNLRKEDTQTARSSRDWLVDQIAGFPDKVDKFPRIYNEKITFFGSFARRTKKRPLDDVDIMICLSAEGSTYYEGLTTISIDVASNAERLKSLCNTDSNTLNSIRVVNKFVSALKTVPQYRSAETKRNQEAAILQLNSYDWNFDIVPCFFTSPDSTGKSYYLIPDGSGGWKKTDPRIDQERTSRINQANDGNVLNIIRVIKYWNKRPTMPSASSYLLETMILNYYESKSGKASQFVDIEIPSILEYIWLNITNDVQDPKGIQGNINHLTDEERSKISTRAWRDKNKAEEARSFERNNEYSRSIKKWAEVFGDDFPSYE